MAIDYLSLIPEKFQKSQMLQDYMSAIGSQFDVMVSDIDGISGLVNPNTVPIEYIQKLSDSVGLDIYGIGSWPDYRLRKQLIQAVDWYKIKGTYQSLADIAYLFGFNAVIKDMWTTDYSTFVTEDWFAGDIGMQPSDLDSSYYKSPHFGTFFLLNVVKYDVTDNALITTWDSDIATWDDASFIWGGRKYLWNGEGLDDLKALVEKIRPVNTVPHYYTLLTPVTKEDGIVDTESGNVSSVVTTDWAYSTTLFDDGKQFDDSELFDNSPSAFFSSITKWKLGIGNKGTPPTHSGFALGSVVLTGTIDSVITGINYHEFKITIPANTVQLGVSELGLFLGDNTTMVLASTFPDIDIGTEATLQINIRVYSS